MNFRFPNRKLLGCAVLLSLPLGTCDAKDFTLMSYNVWKGWSQVDDGFEKGIASIRASGAEVVGLQEASPELAGRIAEALGWNRAEKADGSAQLVSKYPIVDTVAMERLIGARIRLGDTPASEVVVFNCHLDYRFYGPYAAAKPDATSASVLEEEGKSSRAVQMKAMIDRMRPYFKTAGEVPLFLTGDFNCPSPLDWTPACAASHHGIGTIAWPAGSELIAAGFVDSFRAAHPDPQAEPGNTWSAIHKDGEPQDRIDFTWYMGNGVRVASSKTFATTVQTTVGGWVETGDFAVVKGNTWPSDHLAVVTVYHLPEATP